MQTLTPIAAATITLDVFTDGPEALRRRLRDVPEQRAASLLPGGIILEGMPEALTYRLSTGAEWTLVDTVDGFRLATAEGHTVTIRDGQLVLAIAK